LPHRGAAAFVPPQKLGKGRKKNLGVSEKKVKKNFFQKRDLQLQFHRGIKGNSGKKKGEQRQEDIRESMGRKENRRKGNHPTPLMGPNRKALSVHWKGKRRAKTRCEKTETRVGGQGGGLTEGGRKGRNSVPSTA